MLCSSKLSSWVMVSDKLSECHSVATTVAGRISFQEDVEKKKKSTSNAILPYCAILHARDILQMCMRQMTASHSLCLAFTPFIEVCLRVENLLALSTELVASVLQFCMKQLLFIEWMCIFRIRTVN